MKLSSRLLSHLFTFASISLIFSNGIQLHTASAQTTPKVFYKEKFGFCTDSTGAPAASDAQWIALKAGQPLGKPGYLKVFSYGNDSDGGSVNSDPIGLAQGYAFWSKAVYGLTIFSYEFPFDVRLLDSIDYEQKLSGVNANLEPNGTRLALLINNFWYISDRIVRQQGKPGANWKPVSFRPFDETYGTTAYSSTVGPTSPLNFGLRLPGTGTVQAVGVFMEEVNGRVRLDNFRINGNISDGSGISTQEQAPDTSRCPFGSPDTGGVGGVTPTPTRTPGGTGGGTGGDDDDSDGGIDQQIPNETPPPQLRTPTPTPTATKTPRPAATALPTPTATPDVNAQDTYVFCPSSEEGVGHTVLATTTARRALSKLAADPHAVDLRDAAVVSILTSQSLPIGSLVNLKLSDYLSQSGTLSVKSASPTTATSVQVKKKAKKLLDRYISQVRGAAKQNAPLFTSFEKTTKVLTPNNAACLKELWKILKRRARLNQVSSQVTFLK